MRHRIIMHRRSGGIGGAYVPAAHVVSGRGGGVAAIAGFKDLQARLARVEALLSETSMKGEKP